LVLGILGILTILLGATGYGLNPIDDGIGWYPLGTPLLVTQVFLAWLISMGFFGIWIWTQAKRESKELDSKIRLDAVIGFLLWLAAFILWTSQPLKPNWFASEPRPPNEAFYPNSDASVYDITAQNLALGEGFKTRGTPFTFRPMYATFLAVLHALGGPSYDAIIWMQVAVLAFIPVVIYNITTRIHNRFSGLLSALLLTIRETNAIRLGDTISDGHAKLLMPFLPTTLGILLIVLVAVLWLQTSSKRSSYPLVLGGLVGIFMLVRPEVGVLIPFIGLAALLQLRKGSVDWIRAMILITLGLVLTLGPWVWRNYQLTGTIFIDSPQYRLDLITKRYREDPLGFKPTPISELSTDQKKPPVNQTAELNTEVLSPKVTAELEGAQAPKPTPKSTTDPIPQSGESIEDQTERMVDEVVEFAQENPTYLSNFILSHFSNSQIQTILNLPISYPFTYSAINTLGHRSLDQFWRNCCTLLGYVQELPFWPKWNGVFPGKAILPLSINLILLAIGISTAWKEHQFTGLVPTFAALGYYLINALVRNSGGRYILPMDWISVFYFSMGITQVSCWGISFYSHPPDVIFKPTYPNKLGGRKTYRWSILWIAIGFATVGSALPIIERAIPSKFRNTNIDAKITNLLENPPARLSDDDIHVLESFLNNDGMVLYGSALYPRFNKSFQMGSVWYFNQNRPYSHLDFYLSSPHDTGIVLPINASPTRFPHATETLVFACPEYYYFDALAVILYDDRGYPTEVFWRTPTPASLTCPLPPP
jgi:hypothetical protein